MHIFATFRRSEPYGRLRAKRRAFLKGESPDVVNDDLDTKKFNLIEDIKVTTVLHEEAVYSRCYLRLSTLLEALHSL